MAYVPPPHDRLCPAYEHAEEHDDDYWCSDACDAPCQCDLIAKVRTDEQERSVTRQYTTGRGRAS